MVLTFVREDRKDLQLLSDEVAALRNALQELSGERFQPILERHRKLIQENSAAANASYVSDIDESISLAKAGALF